MNTKLRYIALFCAITLALVWCIPSVGQVVKGSISGSVIDPQGAVVSGAQVKAKNTETGVVFATTTDSAGFYRFNLLPVGTYVVEITSQGFKTTTQSNVLVGAGRDTGLGSIKISVGETSTTVEVTGDAPLIETTQSQISSTFAGQTLSTFAGIQENQGLDRLALFVPGVVATRSDNFSNTNGGGFSSNGLRGRNNDQEIDGQNNNDNSVGGPGLFVSDTNFVQQYVIVTNNFGPEYGRNAGSVVNIITKSGGNAWHGSVFGTEYNSYLNALSHTQKANIKVAGQGGPPRTNEEFSGGTIGGPILKNKWFLFGGMDSDLLSGQSVFSSSSLTPTPKGLATLAGCFPTGIQAQQVAALVKFGSYSISAGNPTAPSTKVNNVIVGATTCANVEQGGIVRTLATPFHGFDFVNRVDGQVGSNDSIMGRYLFNRGNNFNVSDNPVTGYGANVTALSQAMLVSETHNFSSHMVNETRVGFDRLNVDFGGNNMGNPFEPAQGGILGALTNVTIQGGNLGFGPATNFPQGRIVNTWQAQDNFNYVWGKHAFKSGVNWTYQRSPNTFLPNINGAYRYSSLASFIAGTPNRIQIAEGNPVLDFREYDTFLYAGDDWKISQNLTLNLGLTWTYYGNPAQLFTDVSTKREANPATALWLQTLPLSVRTNPAIPSVKNSFGPSAGFAYTPQWGGFLTGHGKTTLRGGYRMLYDPPFYNIFLNTSTSSPFGFLQTITGAGLAGLTMPANPTGPNVRTSLAASIATNTFDPRTQNETIIDPNFGPDKVHTWSFGFERELTKNAVVEARYAGNHAINLFQTVDANPFAGLPSSHGLLQDFPNLIPNASAITPCAATTQVGPGKGTDVGRVNCGLGVVRSRNNGGFSDYHALQVEFRANNLFKQLQLRTNYTWSKTLDNVSEIFATGTAGNTLFAAQNPFQTGSAERSFSGLNIPNAFTVSATESIPFFKEQHGWIGHILGGWAVSGSYILASGQGYTPQQGLAEAANTALGNYYDVGFVGAFVGIDTARPFFGNRNAPAGNVGIFAGDACLTLIGAANRPGGTGPLSPICSAPATQLISYNALNLSTSPTIGGCLAQFTGVNVPLQTACLAPVTTNDVRFIINARNAQSVFGTPFGNVPRNALTDAISNRLDATVFKNIKMGERANFEMHLTATNALNHWNYINVDPNLEDAGQKQLFSGFADPSLTGANGRVVSVTGRFTF
ncbi:MAG TPA: carboxypeptidase regulatory-like domain-containing protein [Candidatus Angelobacter sp.]|nr:carboxypeptidase regulatory-like domain-containing protein [Candidatus Angelobacter sp.]